MAGPSSLGSPSSFILGRDPLYSSEREGGHTLFWNHSERWTTYCLEQFWGFPHYDFRMRCDPPCYKERGSHSEIILRDEPTCFWVTSHFFPFLILRRRSLNKVCSCFLFFPGEVYFGRFKYIRKRTTCQRSKKKRKIFSKNISKDSWYVVQLRRKKRKPWHCLFVWIIRMSIYSGSV